MIFDKLAKLAKPTPSDKAVSKAVAGGSLYSEQAVDQYNQFFDNLIRIDTDEVLKKIGVARHELERLLYDDEIDEKVERRLEHLTQARYTLSPSEGDVAEFVYEQLDKHLEVILTASLNSKLYGYSVCEMVWDKAHYQATGVTQPKLVTEKPLEWFEPKNDGRLLYYPQTFSQPIEVDIQFKYLLQQNRPTYKNPKGKAILSRVYWLWYFKKNGWKFWSKFLERFGSPLLIGTTQGETEQLAHALATAHNQSIVAMPDGDTVNTVSASGNGEAFNKYDDAINKRIAKYLLGQTLTSGVDNGGTYGQGVIHQEQQEIIFNSDKNHAKKYVQQFIDVLCLLNGYDAPTFEFQTEKGLQPERAERDVKLHNQGVTFSKDYYVDMYDIDEHYIVEVKTDKPLIPVAKPVNAKHGRHLANTTKTVNSDKTFTPEQQELEILADDVQSERVEALDYQAMVKVITNAKDKDEMLQGLLDMVADELDEHEMTALIETALKVADMHGVVDEASHV